MRYEVINLGHTIHINTGLRSGYIKVGSGHTKRNRKMEMLGIIGIIVGLRPAHDKV